MNTLDELKYYINDRNPVGAIMLTGKWKCGKSIFNRAQFARRSSIITYFIIPLLFSYASV